VDAGEIGAGHQVTALYEVTAPGSPALLTDALRYQSDDAPAAETTSAARAGDGELGYLRLRWKAPGAEISQLIEEPIRADATAAGTEQRFAAAVAGFGQLLRGSNRLGEWGYDDAIALAKGARGPDPFGYRAEAVQLMRLAQSLTASQH
jgi:Ca-activated chloride channel family protein